MMMRYLLVAVLVLSVAGCATPRKKETPKSDVQALKEEVGTLKQEMAEKEKRIQELETSKGSAGYADYGTGGEEGRSRTYGSGSSQAPQNSRNIQKALKNAGFYSGEIDGKIGKMTRKAVREFQASEGLKVDGIVGKKTWARLQSYL
jgi:murein L,D-transpeptidase YcbB/YkuD